MTLAIASGTQVLDARSGREGVVVGHQCDYSGCQWGAMCVSVAWGESSNSMAANALDLVIVGL